MSKQEEAQLILKLYELRRETTMRKARDWFFMEFHPKTLEDFNSAMFSENSGYLRMVVSYWDMAAAFVSDGAISPELFAATNGEYISVFAKVEPLLEQIRAAFAPQFAVQLEKLIDTTPDGRKRVAQFQERSVKMRAQIAEMRAKAHQSKSAAS